MTTSQNSLATLAGLDAAIRAALAAGFTDDHVNLIRIRAKVAAEARAAGDATTTCTDCGGVATRLPLVARDGSASFYCAREEEIFTVYPAAERIAA